jgi:tripeptidyl-peptidase-1
LNIQQNIGGPQSIFEAKLDIQYGLGLAYPTPTIYFSTGGTALDNTRFDNYHNEPYLEFLTYLLALDKILQTISISYGEPEWTVPESYAHTTCDLFARLAARGVTVLVSSGDWGSGKNCSSLNGSTVSLTA